MKKLIFILISLVSIQTFADCRKEPVKIAVIDTGFQFAKKDQVHLCDTGHKSFVYSDRSVESSLPEDIHGHGTNIAGLIEQYASTSNVPYCLLILQYFTAVKPEDRGKIDNLKATIAAIKYATEQGANIINYSGGGTDKSDDEIAAVKAFLNKGGLFVAAAGNERNNLASVPYYPAQDDSRVIVVGNAQDVDWKEDFKDSADKIAKTVKTNRFYIFTGDLDIYDTVDLLGFKVSTHSTKKVKKVLVSDGQSIYLKALTSDYGKRVNRWEVGEAVKSLDITMTGTSQSAAIVTGKLVGERFKCSVGTK